MKRLSKNFTQAELTVTSTGLPNEPTPVESKKLMYGCVFQLQPTRNKYGVIIVTSGFRSLEVNNAVGGSITSQHCLAEAIDFTCPGTNLKEVFEWIVNESGIQFGQCILEQFGEKEWIHISLPRFDKPNQQALTFDGKNYEPYTKN